MLYRLAADAVLLLHLGFIVFVLLGGLLHRADGKAGEVVLAGRVHARHLGSLAANQRTASQLATLGDALDHVGGGVDVELAAGEVIEEEQRLCTLHQDVVDAHRHQILADGVMLVQLEGKLELGAYAIGARHQHRLLELLRQLEQRAEATDAAQHLGAHGALGEGLDAVDQRVAGFDVHTGVAVGKGGLVGGGGCAQDRSSGLGVRQEEGCKKAGLQVGRMPRGGRLGLRP